ncbi:helix-turn-helix domain-containing protein [Paraglaciecola sp.]|uniref:AraC family transcriptional regulator n=1 Tax=Paraglaciecola sp. TaxID=1920173 RepID=UPI003EF2A985
MQPLSSFLAHSAFSLMALCVLLLLPKYITQSNYRKNRSIILFSISMACGCGYLISECFGPLNNMSILWWLEYIAGNALPGVFWLTSISIFSEKNELEYWQYVLASSTLFIPLVSTLLQLIIGFDLRELPAFWGLVTYGALIIELFLIIHALLVAVKTWQADLVQDRRYIRGSVVVFSAMYILLVIVSEQLFNLDWVWLDTVKFLLLLTLITTVNFVLFSLKDDVLFHSPNTHGSPIKPNKAQSLELQRIINCMLTEKFYQNEGVTISLLSRHLSIQEYKLRQLINGELEYRNFNDFLNYYRIKEVTDNLSKAENSHIPVLTLALDSGFRSLSSFNKAFKNTHGITPTEFRNRI